MQFLVLTERLMEKFPEAEWTAERIAAEGQRVRELYAAGVVRQIWRRKDRPGAAIILEAPGEAEAREAVESLPLAKLGMIWFPMITALEPYPAFGPR